VDAEQYLTYDGTTLDVENSSTTAQIRLNGTSSQYGLAFNQKTTQSVLTAMSTIGQGGHEVVSWVLAGTVSAGDLVCLATGAGIERADATSNNQYAVTMLGIAMASGVSSNVIDVLLFGFAVVPITNASVGDPIYMDTTAGAMSFNAPSSSGNVVRLIGQVAYVINATDCIIRFNPSNDWIVI